MPNSPQALIHQHPIFHGTKAQENETDEYRVIETIQPEFFSWSNVLWRSSPKTHQEYIHPYGLLKILVRFELQKYYQEAFYTRAG